MSLQGRCECVCPPVVFPQATTAALIRGREHVVSFLQLKKERLGATDWYYRLSGNIKTTENWKAAVG